MRPGCPIVTDHPAGAATVSSLVARCRRGDQDAWRALVEEHSRYVYAVITRGYRIVGDDADDVFQDVFGRVFERLQTLRDDAALLAWIGQLTRSMCVDHLRRSRRMTVELHDEIRAADERELEQIEAAVVVRTAMTGLSGSCREILDRFYMRDESYAVIGDALGIPAGTIASRLSRCLDRLRAEVRGRTEPPNPSDRA